MGMEMENHDKLPEEKQPDAPVEKKGRITLREWMGWPTGQKLLGGMAIVILALASVVIYLNRGWNECRDLRQQDTKDFGDMRLADERRNSERRVTADSTATAQKEMMYQAAIKKLEAKEEAVDAAMAELQNALKTQSRTRQHLKEIDRSATKIMQHAQQ